ncbi:MAG TPA: class I SAM-dependent methyltransferase [Phycisphaerae bacterium]|nr:class I SAM-dependent methyltransferase [Phycisphaerae bacterium]
MDHQLKRETLAEFGDWAATYDAHWLNRFLFEPSHAALLRELNGVPPGLALDIGCGTGELAIRLARQGWHVVGLDLCVAMLHHARHKLNGQADRIHLTAGDSEHLPFGRATFDAVTCANAFHHFPNQQSALREMSRILRSGGCLFVIDGWPDHWMGRVIYDLVIARVERSVWHREAKDMRALFRTAGLVEVTQRRLYSPFPLLLTRGDVPGTDRNAGGQESTSPLRLTAPP